MLLAALAAAVVVAGVPHALTVAVVLVALSVPVMLVVGPGLRRAAVVVVLTGTLADAGLGSGGDTAAARALGGRDSRAGHGSGRRRSAGSARGRRLARAHRWNAAGRAGRLVPLERGRNNGGDLTGSRRGRGDRSLLTGRIEKARRSQYEADRGQYGEQADNRCGYARKTTPHDLSIGVPAPALNPNVGFGLYDPSARVFCSMRALVGACEIHPSRPESPFPCTLERPLLLNIT
jgi:hypothetical protein